MILIIDADSERLATVCSGLFEAGQPVMGLDRVEAATQLVRSTPAALVVLSDAVRGWAGFLRDLTAPVLLITDDPDSEAAAGAAAVLGDGIRAGSVLQMALALVGGGGSVVVDTVGTPPASDGAMRARTPQSWGIMTEPALPEPGEGDEGPAGVWEGVALESARRAAREKIAERNLRRYGTAGPPVRAGGGRTSDEVGNDAGPAVAEPRRTRPGRVKDTPANAVSAGSALPGGSAAQRPAPSPVSTPGPEPVGPGTAEPAAFPAVVAGAIPPDDSFDAVAMGPAPTPRAGPGEVPVDQPARAESLVAQARRMAAAQAFAQALRPEASAPAAQATAMPQTSAAGAAQPVAPAAAAPATPIGHTAPPSAMPPAPARPQAGSPSPGGPGGVPPASTRPVDHPAAAPIGRTGARPETAEPQSATVGPARAAPPPAVPPAQRVAAAAAAFSALPRPVPRPAAIPARDPALATGPAPTATRLPLLSEFDAGHLIPQAEERNPDIHPTRRRSA